MKKKNGFTLVELVAILAVLGVIAILVLPGVKSNINNKKEKQYNNIVNVIENAAKSYYYQTSSGTKITLEELANNKYIDPDITNPKTNEKMTGCVVVSKDNGYNTFKYIDESSCEKLLPGYGKGTKYIKELYKNETERTKNGLKKDNTSDANIRYEGSNPNNYVKFNDELWRIIGVFGDNIKLIRNEALGDLSWDSSESSINRGLGVNEWSRSDLKEYLNTMYYGGSAVTCYNEANNTTTTCPAASLNEPAKTMIDDHTWNTGAIEYATRKDTIAFYNAERGSLTGKKCTDGVGCNDTVTRTTSWTGYVALPYTTDWAYASSKVECQTNLQTASDDSSSYFKYICTQSNWMWHSDHLFMWMLSPAVRSSEALTVWYACNNGFVNDMGAYSAYSVFPTIYLKSDIKIVGGTGIKADPYILSRS
ncbi:MAG: type II secretion system protein [Bacilli bacterium]